MRTDSHLRRESGGAVSVPIVQYMYRSCTRLSAVGVDAFVTKRRHPAERPKAGLL